MADRPGERVVWGYFEFSKAALGEIAGRFVADPDAIVEDARQRLETMLPDLAYVDDPRNPMAGSMFMCQIALSAYLALAERGVDIHAYGAEVLEWWRSFDPPESDGLSEELLAAAAQSQTNAKKGEFVWEVSVGDGPGEYEMTIRSCGICASFSKYGAMELVPYMCAGDDVFSDKLGQGLRRTGTIGLGAECCDFKYKAGGEPLRLAEQYPLQIRPRVTS